MHEPGITSLDFCPFEGVTAFTHNWNYIMGLNESNMDLEFLVVKVRMLSKQPSKSSPQSPLQSLDIGSPQTLKYMTSLSTGTHKLKES